APRLDPLSPSAPLPALWPGSLAPLLPEPAAGSGSPTAAAPDGCTPDRSGQITAAVETPRHGLRPGTAPGPACASRPPRPAGHRRHRGPSWPHTRDGRPTAAPAATPRNTANAAPAHSLAC